MAAYEEAGVVIEILAVSGGVTVGYTSEICIGVDVRAYKIEEIGTAVKQGATKWGASGAASVGVAA